MRRDAVRFTKGLSFPKLGDLWYVFVDGKNVLMGLPSEQEARDAATRHFARGRKKNI
jgi:hypothetical protein